MHRSPAGACYVSFGHQWAAERHHSTSLPFGEGCEAVAYDQHPDYQFGID